MFPNRPPHLSQIWISKPVFFVTIVTNNRIKVLNNILASNILRDTWVNCKSLYGWSVGEYVIMPDHLHFFILQTTGTEFHLSKVMGNFKKFTARNISIAQHGFSSQLWQPGFFDRLMRSEKEWEEKRHYMLQNPVRAGLVKHKDEWPYRGDLDMFRI